MKVLAAGGSGLAGSRLCPALAETGHDVVTMTPHPGSYDGAGTPIHGDVHDPATLSTALDDGETACYLVHSLSGADSSAGRPDSHHLPRARQHLVEADETAVEQLPVMVTPKWGQHPHPPIAAGDAVGLLRFGPAFQRRWSPYLACFEAGFRADYLDVHQLLLEHGW